MKTKFMLAKGLSFHNIIKRFYSLLRVKDFFNARGLLIYERERIINARSLLIYERERFSHCK